MKARSNVGAVSSATSEVRRKTRPKRIEGHHGRPVEGWGTVDALRGDTVVVRAQEAVDAREFDVAVPTTLGLAILFEMSVELHPEAAVR